METTNDKEQVKIAVQASTQEQLDKWVTRGERVLISAAVPFKGFFRGIKQGYEIIKQS